MSPDFLDSEIRGLPFEVTLILLKEFCLEMTGDNDNRLVGESGSSKLETESLDFWFTGFWFDSEMFIRERRCLTNKFSRSSSELQSERFDFEVLLFDNFFLSFASEYKR